MKVYATDQGYILNAKLTSTSSSISIMLKLGGLNPFKNLMHAEAGFLVVKWASDFISDIKLSLNCF